MRELTQCRVVSRIDRIIKRIKNVNPVICHEVPFVSVSLEKYIAVLHKYDILLKYRKDVYLEKNI